MRGELIEYAQHMLTQVHDTHGFEPIVWFYSALFRFNKAGFSLQEVLAELEKVDPDTIAAWKEKYGRPQ